jgi:putative sigma-54 modulation protein
MSIEVTARHMEEVGPMQEYARSRAQALADGFPKVEYVHVILDSERHLWIAEVVVQAKKKIRVEAKESSENLRASIDAAVVKVERQLRRFRDRTQDLHRVAPAE